VGAEPNIFWGLMMVIRIMLAATALLFLAVVTDAQALDAKKINNPHVAYVTPEALKEYPLPVLDYQHDWEKYES
jgi:hypothetical protein